MNKNPLLDEEFLKEMYLRRDREIFAKIIALTLENDPIEEIQGQVTGGSISLDGSSSVRRTCNLSLVAKDLNINQYYWGLKNRFKLYIGLKNNIGWGYEDIIWFPMGTYVISNFNTSQSTNNYTISITGKDKMTLLNGELSGSLFASIDFGKEEYYENGITTISYIPIKNIIREAVHAYANEVWENIIINDLEDYGIELLDYKGKNPMYMIFSLGADNTKNCETYSFYGDEMEVYPVKWSRDHWAKDENDLYVIEAELDENGNEKLDDNGNRILVKPVPMEEIEERGYNYDPQIELNLEGQGQTRPTLFCLGDPSVPENRRDGYTIAKIVNGQTCGYRLTDITYPGELILGIGEPITSMLDKLVNMLGNFEYFYDIDGRFVFQRKQTFIDKSWNTIKTGNDTSYITTADETYAEAAAYATPVTWTFGDSFLVTAYANTPVLSNVRNDFSIWGTKASVTGSELPVHLRYAVDKKPTYYKTIEYTKKGSDGNVIIDEETGEPKIFGGVEWTTEVGTWWIKDGEGVVDASKEELEKLVREEAKEKIRRRIERNIESFTPNYAVANGLQEPTPNGDGSWSNGWWDIRDWHRYYVGLTDSEPRGTMKWYSYNNTTGCQLARDALIGLYNEGYQLENSSWETVLNNENLYVWLIIVDENAKTVDIIHGSGNPYDPSSQRDCTYYESYLNNEPLGDKVILSGTRYSIRSNNQTVGTTYQSKYYNPVSKVWSNIKAFISPFRGCSDNHTFLTFLVETMGITATYDETSKKIIWDDTSGNGKVAYFYSPNFPTKKDDESFEEFIEEEVQRQLTQEEIDKIIKEKGYRIVERKAENLCDWREIIFQMALDYRKHNHEDDFYLKVRNTNGLDLNNQWYYPAGKTGYEQYYVDMEGFWRQLYCPPQLMKILYPSGVWTERNQTGWYSTGAISADSENGIYFGSSSGIVYQVKNRINNNVSYDDWDNEQWVNSWIENQDENDGWNVEILDSPETLNFWFDFLEADEEADLTKYSVPAIGDRTKSVNDSMVKAIYFRETPTALFTENIQTIDRKSGYTYLQYNPENSYLFNISSQGKSAYDVMQEYINVYLYCIESISITSVPISNLQPNTRVMVYDEDSKINGQYLVNKITIPLVYNGTMSVSAVKSAEIIY